MKAFKAKAKPKKKALQANHIEDFVSEWNTLRSSLIATDYEIAQFFRRERRMSGYYAPGTSGDEHFKRVVNKHLIGITGAKALRYVKLLGAFTEAAWKALGGYPSISYIHRLDCTSKQRCKLRMKVHQAADRAGQPATPAICRKAAIAMGLVTAVPETVSTMEKKRDVLAQYIYDTLDWNIPQEIIDAMPPAMQEEYAEHLPKKTPKHKPVPTKPVTMTAALRRKIIAALKAGRDTKSIAVEMGVTPAQARAIKAHVTMGRYKKRSRSAKARARK